MIRHLTNNQIDKAKWDHCVESAFNGIIYAYSWYLDIVSPDWEALVEGDYETIMPLPKKSKLGISYLRPPFFTQQLGVFSTNILTAEKIHDFLMAIPSKYLYWEVNLNTFNKINKNGYQLKANITHELDLIPSYELLLNHYSENAKRNIRKAIKNECKIVYSLQVEDVIKIFREHRGKDIPFGEDEYNLLNNIVNMCLQKGKGQVWGVTSKDGELYGGAVFIESNGKVIYLFSGTSDKAREIGAMPFLIDRFISHNAQRNLTLDFEGSNDPDLARFYKSFGSKECVYLQIKNNRLPWPLQLIKN